MLYDVVVNSGVTSWFADEYSASSTLSLTTITRGLGGCSLIFSDIHRENGDALENVPNKGPQYKVYMELIITVRV